MNERFQAIESKISSTADYCHAVELVKRISGVCAVMTLIVLAVGWSIHQEWIRTKPVALAILALFGVASLGWLVFLITRVVFRSPKQTEIAAMLERANAHLLDRLNTTVFLGERMKRERSHPLAPHIAGQALDAMKQRRTRGPVSAVPAAGFLCLFVAMLALTIWFYHTHSPWARLAGSEEPPMPMLEELPAFALPATNLVEEQLPWGEVRITNPGADVKVTTSDRVPLQLEVAANERLQQVTWHSSVNGSQERKHQLPHPTEAYYAAYDPVIEIEEFQLSDWDVLAYYGRAVTEKETRYASPIYFVEVQPAPEKLAGLPGGQNGTCHLLLSELTAMIYQQQHVIRDTYSILHRGPNSSGILAQEVEQLASTEAELAEATDHVQAKIAVLQETKLSNSAIDATRQSLSNSLSDAKQSLKSAAKWLQMHSLTNAVTEEQKALAHLASARKHFQHVISTVPEQFEEPDHSPLASDEKAYREIAEFRDEYKAAADFIKALSSRQEKLAHSIGHSRPESFPALVDQQQAIETALQEFREKHPAPFLEAASESQQTEAALQNSALHLQNRNRAARSASRNAANQMQNLAEAIERRSAAQQLANAYQIRELLERQIQTFGQCEQSGGAMSTDQLRKTAEAAQHAVRELQLIAHDSPARNAFKEPLRDALAQEKRNQIAEELQQAQRAATESEKQSAAGQACRSLRAVADAFDQSRPAVMQNAQHALSNGRNAAGQSATQLKQLIDAVQADRQNASSDQLERMKQLAAELRQALARESSAGDPTASQLAAQLDQLERGELPVDLEILNWLARELDRLASEPADAPPPRPIAAELTNIDPSELPPIYRPRIESYFRKLSEQ